MRIGIYFQTADRGSHRMFRIDQLASQIQRAEELGFDSAWVMDHAFLETPNGPLSGHDPVVLLGYAAAHTKRIKLGTLVLCSAFRSVGQLGREAVALADATGGRFILGLGCGWYQPEFHAFDYPFDHLVGRFEEQLIALHRLFTEERVTIEGKFVRLRDASVVRTFSPPPIWIAGKGPRMLRLTAQHADGWNLAWGDLDPSWLNVTLSALNRELDAVGRDRSKFTVSAGIRLTLDADHTKIVSAVRAYQAVGVDLVILSLAVGADKWYMSANLDQVATVLSTF